MHCTWFFRYFLELVGVQIRHIFKVLPRDLLFRLSGPESMGCSDHERFEAELEFIQGLSSPQYINCKALVLLCTPLCKYHLQDHKLKATAYPHCEHLCCRACSESLFWGCSFCKLFGLPYILEAAWVCLSYNVRYSIHAIYFPTLCSNAWYLGHSGIVLSHCWHLSCRYPHCLYFLDLLLSREFRNSMASSNSKVNDLTPLQ